MNTTNSPAANLPAHDARFCRERWLAAERRIGELAQRCRQSETAQRADLEKQLAAARTESNHWHELLRDTVDAGATDNLTRKDDQ